MKYAPVPDAAAVLAHLDHMEEVKRQQAEKMAQLRFQMEWQLAVESLGLRLEDVARFTVDPDTLRKAVAHIQGKGRSDDGTVPEWRKRMGAIRKHRTHGTRPLTFADYFAWVADPQNPTVVTHALMEDNTHVELPQPIVKVRVP